MGLFHSWVLLAFLALTVGCSGGGSSSPSPSLAPIAACDAAAQIDFVQDVIDSWYLWYGEMAQANKSDYDSAQAYLDARLAPLIAERQIGRAHV